METIAIWAAAGCWWLISMFMSGEPSSGTMADGTRNCGAESAFFVANRLLPLGITFAGYDRAALQIWSFYLAWLTAFAHAWLRPQRAWIEQCWTLAALAVVAALLNWVTTGDHLGRSLSHRHLRAVAGMDLLLLAGAAIAMFTATRLRRRSMVPGK